MMAPFCSELKLDADYGAHGWEIVLRFDAESMEGAYTDLTDEQLPGIVGEPIAAALIAERERTRA